MRQVFAYGFGRLATLGYKYVGQDQLIGGTWPDNEPAVSLAGGDTFILKVLIFIRTCSVTATIVCSFEHVQWGRVLGDRLTR
jgi:hypothetical protein